MNYHVRLDIEKDIIRNIYANPYYWNRPDYFMTLLSVIKSYRNSYANVLTHRMPEITEWIDEILPMLKDRTYKLSTKLFWIMSGMTSFNKCPACGKEIGIRQNVNITRGYCRFCSLRCSQPAKVTREKVRASVLNRLKEDPDFFIKAEVKKKLTKLSHGMDPNWNNREQAQRTCETTYGACHPMKNTDVSCRTADTKERKYGDRSYTNRRKSVNTMRARHGIDWPMQDDNSVRLGMKTKLDKYGTTTPLGKYSYDGKLFDSKPELAFYVWLKDSNSDFEYHPPTSFIFEYDGKSHEYWPDFRIGDSYAEIKGDQFFREDGTMFCPYRRKSWSDEDYESICGLYAAKGLCMITNGVSVIKSAEYEKYITYVETVYGRRFFLEHKKRRDK